MKCTRLPRTVVTATNLASLRGKSLTRVCAVVTIAPWSYETAAIPRGDALFRKQFGPERSAPLPCPHPVRSRVSTAPRSIRALADARQSPVPLARALLEDLAVDALSIIANPQPEELAVVGDFGLDAAGVRVVKSVSQDLARDPVDLVLKKRRQGLPRSFHSDLESRRFALRDWKISRAPFLRL